MNILNRIYSHGQGSRFYCPVCSGTRGQRKTNVAVDLLDENGDRILSDLCLDCVEAGHQGTVERMRESIRQDRERLSERETFLAEFAKATVESWPTLADWDAVKEDWWREVMG